MGWQCPVCGKTFRRTLSPPVYCSCGYIDRDGAQQLRGLGDWIAKHLHRVGITPRRFAMLQFWRPASRRRCRCKERQERLNTLSQRVTAWADRTRQRLSRPRAAATDQPAAGNNRNP